MDNLKDKTAKGLFWGALNSGTTQVLNIVIGIFLGRLLCPADYGLIAMLTIFTAIAGNLQSSGFSTALVNIKKPTEDDYNSVFWFNILTSITLYIILFFCAPLIAQFYHQPRLIPLSRFVFLSFVIGSIGITPNAYMTKHLMIREVTVISTLALVSSGIASIVLAFNGMAYWSFAWQQVIYITVLNVGRFYYCSWRPSFHITFKPIKAMFGFSYKILITMIMNTANNNILTIIFGRLFTPKVVGNFSQAYQWDVKAYSFVANTMQQVAQPVFASITDEAERERRVFRKMMRFTAFLSFPALFGLALVAREFIVIAITAKWLDSVPLLQILCLGGAFFPFYTVYQNLMIGKGRSDIYMWCNIFQIIIQFALILVTYRFGIVTMVAVYSAFNVVWLLAWQHYAKRIIGVGLMSVLRDVAPFMLASAAVMAVTYFITMGIHSNVLLLILRVLIAGTLYFAVMKIANVEILNECLQFVKKKTNKQ
jgi:teichuronic acid exporter